MRDYRWTLALALLSLGFVLFCADRRESFSTVWGDESTYLAMAESLVRDGDLLFTSEDAERLAGAEPPARSTVILQRSGGVIAYSKPILHALLAAPGVLVAGRFGLILVNGLILALALWSAWPFLCRLGSRAQAALTLVTFTGASVLLPHVGWQMSDLAQAALTLVGAALALTTLRRPPADAAGWLDGPTSAWLGGVSLGLLTTARLPNVLIAATVVAVLVVTSRYGRAVRVATGALLAFVAMAMLSQVLTGAPNAYRAERASFDASSGYPVSPDDEAHERFVSHRTTQAMSVKPRLQPSVSAYSTLYFFVGRHSGLLWYFPALVALIAASLRRPDRVTLVLLAGAAAASAFYLIWWPSNYFGGSTFLGNRYFLSTYPLLLFAMPRLPGRFSLAVTWILAVAVGGSAAVAVTSGELPAAASQSHTRAGIFTHAPYESTGRNIDGRRDRYWSRDLVRFVQPVPGVGADSFVLEAGAPPTEILLVTRRENAPLLLRYRTPTAGLELVVESDGETRSAPLDRGGRVRRGALLIPLADSWRRHGYWWSHEELYSARSVRLSLQGALHGEARARFWYGGDPEHLEKSLLYTARLVRLPGRVTAGSSLDVVVDLRNTSPVPWASDGAFPVSLAYRLWPLDDVDPSPLEGPRVALEEPVKSGDPVRLTLPITWPERPGRYRLAIDLLIEDYAWFESRLGRPVAETAVEVIDGPGKR